MNKYLKYSLIAAAGVVALYLLFILVVSLSFDAKRYQQDMVKLVQEKKQRTLNLSGDLRLTFFPKLGVELGHASLSEFSGAREFAAVDSARLSLSWLRLLRGELVVDGVRLVGLQANLVRFKGGSTNFDDLLTKEEATQFKFAIDRIEAGKSEIHWRDEMAGRSLALNALALRVHGLSEAGAAALEADFRLTGDDPRLDLQTHVTGGLLADGRAYAFKHFNLEATGEAGGMRGWAVGVKGDLELDSRSRHFTLENLALAVTRKYGTTDMDVRVTSPRMVYGPEHVLVQKIDLVGKIQDGQHEASMVLSVPEISGAPQSLKGELRLVANAHMGDGAVTVRLASGMAVGAERSRLELPRLDIDLALDHPQAPRGGVRTVLVGSAVLDGDKRSAGLDVDGHLDGSKLALKLRTASLARPHLDFDAGVERIDFDRYLAAAGSAGTWTNPDQGMEASAPRGLRADGVLRAGVIRLNAAEVRNVRLDVRIADGKLSVSPFRMPEHAVRGRVKEEPRARLDNPPKRQLSAR